MEERPMSREEKGTTKSGYVNRNAQITIRDTGDPGTDFGARKFQLACRHCGWTYGVNSTDIWERKCPQCQNGAEGLPLNVNNRDDQKPGIKAFFGSWPGDETDEELLEALKELRDAARSRKAAP